MCGAVAGLGTVFRVAKLDQTGLLEGCHVGPTGQATRRRAAADGSFMGHRFLKKLLFKYTGAIFWPLFDFLHLFCLNVRIQLGKTFNVDATQSDNFKTDTQKDEFYR